MCFSSPFSSSASGEVIVPYDGEGITIDWASSENKEDVHSSWKKGLAFGNDCDCAQKLPFGPSEKRVTHRKDVALPS